MFRFCLCKLNIARLIHSLGKKTNQPPIYHSLNVDSLLVSPLGQAFTRVFIDKFNDVVHCQLGRGAPWKILAQQFVTMGIRTVLLTATGPPHRITSYIKPFGMNRKTITEIRSSTNRPEIGLHVVHTEPIDAMQSLRRLVSALSIRLAADERILVFCSYESDADELALLAKCAVYRNNLGGVGNTKENNLDQWNEGLSKVMACTTAFNQGMATPHVRYMVIFRPVCGLVLHNQMLGLVGRDGMESHVFFLVDDGPSSFRVPLNDQCVNEFEDVVYGNRCRRLTNTLCMDGRYLAVRCIDEPQGIHCDVCNPNSVMQRLAVESIKFPLRALEPVPVFTVPQVIVHGSALQGPTHSPKNLFMGFVKASSMVPRDMMVCVISATLLCSS